MHVEHTHTQYVYKQLDSLFSHRLERGREARMKKKYKLLCPLSLPSTDLKKKKQKQGEKKKEETNCAYYDLWYRHTYTLLVQQSDRRPRTENSDKEKKRYQKRKASLSRSGDFCCCCTCFREKSYLLAFRQGKSGGNRVFPPRVFVIESKKKSNK